MSVTVSTCFQICNSPLNKSSAKNLFSFPKSDRFKSVGKSMCDKYYELPPVREKRSAGIGYATKYDFTKSSSKNPAPNNYQVVGDIENNKFKKKGYIFGVSRDAMKFGGITGVFQKVPGPGNYDLGSTKTNIKYSFRQRVSNNDPMNTGTQKNPGPGQYQPPATIDQKGRYFISKFKNSGAKTFDPPRSKRFPESTKHGAPGPGNYELKIGITQDGKYFVSTFKSSKCRTFPHEMRKTLSSGTFLQTPGPGSYRLPSEFGYYESKDLGKEKSLSPAQKKEETKEEK